MRRIGNTLIFAGVVLIFGPFFGFTIRGQQETGYGEGFLLGIISIVIGVIILIIKNQMSKKD